MAIVSVELGGGYAHRLGRYCVGNAFHWGSTPQGQDFWSAVYEEHHGHRIHVGPDVDYDKAAA